MQAEPKVVHRIVTRLSFLRVVNNVFCGQSQSFETKSCDPCPDADYSYYYDGFRSPTPKKFESELDFTQYYPCSLPSFMRTLDKKCDGWERAFAN